MATTTTNLDPNADGSTLQWTPTPGATHYTGIDEDKNGIGDTPYTIYQDNNDIFPLINPVKI